MNVSCPRCGATVPAEDVNITRMVAKCRACQAVFSFDPPARPIQTEVPQRSALAPMMEVPLPAGIELHRDSPATPASGDYRTAPGGVGRLRIVRRWFTPQHIFMLLFAIVWNGFMVLWIGGAIASGGGVWPILFSSLHVAVGLWVAYTAIAGLFNRTVIEIDRGVLSVRHGPIPAAGNRDIAITDLRQLFTVQNVGNKGARSYELHAIVSNGPTVSIAKGLTDERQALFLERTIEDHLGIVDQRVPGEMPK
jgi:hypothetical protein